MMAHGIDKLELIKIRHTCTNHTHTDTTLYNDDDEYVPTQSVIAKIFLVFDEIYLNITYSA